MQIATDRPQAPTAIRTDLGAIFVSLELSRSTWLITSLSPGGGEKMSKHTVRSGDVAGLRTRFSQLKDKVQVRMGQIVPIIVIQEAGLDGFWIHRLLQDEGVESHVVDPASIATSRRRNVKEFEGDWSRIRRCPVVGGIIPQLFQPTAGCLLCRIGADPLAERIRRSRTRRLQSRKPAAANNHDPARLVVGKASAPFDTDPVVSSTRTAQWWPSSESTDRCLGAKAADRLLEICDCRGCLGRSRDNGRLKTKAFSLPTFRGLISSGGSR